MHLTILSILSIDVNVTSQLSKSYADRLTNSQNTRKIPFFVSLSAPWWTLQNIYLLPICIDFIKRSGNYSWQIPLLVLFALFCGQILQTRASRDPNPPHNPALFSDLNPARNSTLDKRYNRVTQGHSAQGGFRNSSIDHEGKFPSEYARHSLGGRIHHRIRTERRE